MNISQFFDAGQQIAHLPRSQFFARFHAGAELADFQNVMFTAIFHESDFLTFPNGSFFDADVGDDTFIDIVFGIEDQRA